MQERTRNATVVFPFVPVTARFVSFEAGLPLLAWASKAAARAESLTIIISMVRALDASMTRLAILANDVFSAVGNRLVDKVMAVINGAFNGYEDIAGFYKARINTNIRRFARGNKI